MLDDITPLVLTRDEAPNIARTLGQLRWARDVVVVDSMSEDETVAIARSFPNVRVVERPFDSHAAQWQFGVAQVRTPWVLTLDADYFVPEAAVREMAALAPPPDVVAYAARFRYAIDGRTLRATLYTPRPVLLRIGAFEIWQDGHTQRTRVNGRTETLSEPFVHDDRKPWPRFVARQRLYARQEAEKLRRADPRTLNAAARLRKLRSVAPFAVLAQTLFVKGLILDGRAGLRYAMERFVAEWLIARELWRS
ncbi:MAG TPA: glycosyltransferase family 2 protein [Thermoanaerobaculia bacterium]|nr:glycosyltransferase family 2 protein [Thermoanaerobaculia bacterium]